ncbi:MAG: hypothetical protein AAGF77_00010 [Bacteroidota bacterium]
MKNLVIILFMCLTLGIHGQAIVTHTTASGNTSGHITTINSPHTNGKPNAVLIIDHNYGVYNVNEVGVWYSNGKWKIFNQNRKAMPLKAKYNILVLPQSRANVFVHTTTSNNSNAHITTLNTALTNAKPNAMVFITQRYGKYNTSKVGVYYAGSKWKIFNEEVKKPMPIGTKFNVVVLNPGTTKLGNLSLQAFVYKNTSNGHISKITAPKAIAKNSTLFATQHWKGVYNPNSTGVWYNGSRWTVYNQNRKPIPQGVRYNVMAFRSASVASLFSSGNVTTAIVKPNILQNAGLIRMTPIATADAKDTDRRGPDVALAETFPGVSQMEMMRETFNLHREFYRDQNNKSNVYYYLPKRFTLQWDARANDYAFNVFYMSSEGNARGSVLLNMEVTSGLKGEEIEWAEQLLSQSLRKRVTLLPLDLRDVPQVDFGGLLSRFQIAPESVGTNIPSDYKQPIVLDWRMDSNIDDFVNAMLSTQMTAMMQFKPYGDSTAVREVPIQLKVNSSDTFGQIKFDTASDLQRGWANYLDYPIFPSQLTVLKKRSGRLTFERHELGRQKIDPGATFKITNPTILAAISQAVVKGIWLNYDLEEGCTACNQTVKRKIIGGTAGSEITNVEIQVLNALSYSGAQFIRLNMKSLQADPNGLSEVELPTHQITEDGQSISGIQFFVPQGKTLSYDYQVMLIMPNGDIRNSEWIKADSKLMVLGETQINQLFPNKKKDDLIDNAKDSLLEKMKDSLGIGDEEDLIDKGLEALGDLFSSKKDSTETKAPTEHNDLED